jgi:uncharacterized protein YeaO (DUF488 family)
MERGKKLADYPKHVREGTSQDTRKHTRNNLRPDALEVRSYLADPSPAAWQAFEAAYLDELNARFVNDRSAFDALASLASEGGVFLGCNCPTSANPDVNHCHTVLALGFMQRKYPELEVEFP